MMGEFPMKPPVPVENASGLKDIPQEASVVEQSRPGAAVLTGTCVAPPPLAIAGVTATVYDDGTMDSLTHASSGNDWEDTRKALLTIKTELSRILEQGEANCPFARARG